MVTAEMRLSISAHLELNKDKNYDPHFFLFLSARQLPTWWLELLELLAKSLSIHTIELKGRDGHRLNIFGSQAYSTKIEFGLNNNNFVFIIENVLLDLKWF